MHPTLEVRWFLKGQLPTELHRWFVEHSAVPIEPEAREDWYLYSPKNRDLGIKLRQGSLEIKQRLGSRGACKLAKQVRGRVEEWVKWHFPLDGESGNSAIPASSDRLWIPVHKKRWSQHYAITTAKTIEQVESVDQAEQGCSLELSDLQVSDQYWHSLCFETFGSPEALEQNLERVVQHVARNGGFPALKARHSLGYPHWLKQVRQKAP